MLSSWLWKFSQTCAALMVRLELALSKIPLYVNIIHIVHYFLVAQFYGSHTGVLQPKI